MATIVWERWETFKASERYGIILDEFGTALVFTLLAPLEYRIERKAEPPDNALPAEVNTMPKDIQLALDAVAVAVGQTNLLQRSIKNHVMLRNR